MFIIKTDSGEFINGSDINWDKVPEDVVVDELSVQILMVDGQHKVALANDHFRDFDQCGFQRYDVSDVDGSALQMGVQVILVIGRMFLTADINLSTGERNTSLRPLSDMTYNKKFLRRGKGSAMSKSVPWAEFSPVG